MQDWLSARAQTTPQQTALITPTQQITYAELDRQVTAMHGRWWTAGIRPGDHAALLAERTPESVVQVFTALRAGVVLVPINTRLTITEMRQQMINADCTWLLPAGPAALVDALREDGPPVAQLDTNKVDPPPASAIELNTPFAIIHTSGTSGTPKGAVLTAGNVFHSATASAYHLGTLPDDRWLCVLPLYHVGGLSILLRACLYGITVDLLDGFDLETVNRKLSTAPVTLVSLVPTMLYRLLEHGTPERWTHLRLILLGGAAASATLLERCRALNLPVATTYGLSEAASQVATALPDLAARKPGTVGKPLLFTQVRVVDDHGTDQPPGNYGEVIVSGPTVMQGYYNNPAATARSLRDGWLHTGDIGYLDEDGDLFIVQRRSDLIVTGGENVYPAEVEAVLKAHPAVKEAVVVGVDHPEWGQQVAAAVVLVEDNSLTEAALIAYSRTHLAGYKIPRRVRFVKDLPQTASGKIQRGAVRALLAE